MNHVIHHIETPPGLTLSGWILAVIGGTMNHMIFLLAAADTFLCRPMRLKIWNQNPKSKGL